MLKQIPHLGWILGFCAMASLGLPGLAGFWGEFPAILSAYNPAAALPEETFRTYMVIAAVGTVLAAAYLLWLYQRTAFGEPTVEMVHDDVHDVNIYEWVAWTPMLIMIIVLGLFPNLLFDVMNPAVEVALSAIGARP
jgi:NADH-quinone oxidoreductase subunit M